MARPRYCERCERKAGWSSSRPTAGSTTSPHSPAGCSGPNPPVLYRYRRPSSPPSATSSAPRQLVRVCPCGCAQMPPQRWALPGPCTPRHNTPHCRVCTTLYFSRVWCSGRLLCKPGAWCDTSGKRKNARGHTLCHRCACLCPSRHVMWWRPSVPYLYESGSYFCVPVFACVEACTLCTKNGGGTHVMPVSFLHPLATVSRMLCLCGQVRHRHLVQVQRRHQAPLTSLAQRSWRRLQR